MTQKAYLMGVQADLMEYVSNDIQHYKVQVELTITTDSIGNAISAVAEALSDLVG